MDICAGGVHIRSYAVPVEWPCLINITLKPNPAAVTYAAAVKGVKLEANMVFNYSVSFEHDTKPVMTHRGQIEAKEPSEASRKAIVRAEKALKLRVWRSVVAVLEKVDDESTESTAKA